MTTLTIPRLETERLVLRAPKLSDFEHIAAYYTSPRSVWEGGPLTRAASWSQWSGDAGLWLLRGYGPFGLDDKASGAYLGEVGIYQRDDFPCAELGWFVLPEAEGRGIAHEAARAVMGWLRNALGWGRVCSIIDPGNARSIALGLRLGGRIDESLPGIDPGDVVIAHDLGKIA
jgi:RimJ/RimL family protein N-acetyltransferase